MKGNKLYWIHKVR